MRDKDLLQLMESWADHETESAPEMQPTARMYRLVRARKKTMTAMPSWGWAAAGAALASLVALVILYTLILPGPSSNQQVAAVGLREGVESDRGITTKGTDIPPEKGSEKGPARGHKKEPPSFQHLEFQVQRSDSQLVESTDIREPQLAAITLTSADSYGLVLVPAAEGYVYIYQQSPSGMLTQLLPNRAYSPVQNPLRQEQTSYVPEEPNWFYLDDRAGQVRLTILASVQPLPELQDLYDRYSQADDSEGKQALTEDFLKQVDATRATLPEEVAVWEFVFTLQ